MIRLLPSWVLLGGGVLAFIAGIVNVVGFLSFQQQAITHLTGTLSLLGAALAEADRPLVLHLLASIGSFCLGAMVSGMVVQDSTLRLGRRYSVVLLLEAGLLLLAIPLLQQGSAWGLYAAGVAIGMQNAMASTYSGAVIRTAHVTGMFTDLGIALGHLLRGVAVERRRLQVCVLVIVGFLFGGVAGALGFRWLGYPVLALPAALNLLAAAGYSLYRLRRRRERSDAR